MEKQIYKRKEKTKKERKEQQLYHYIIIVDYLSVVSAYYVLELNGYSSIVVIRFPSHQAPSLIF